MKFHIDYNHRDFYEKHHFIEFEGLLSDVQLQALQEQAAASFLNPRRKTTLPDPALGAEKMFLEGRDLWRKQPELKKVATKRDLAEIAAELTATTPIRLCYDQYLPGLDAAGPAPKKNIYENFLKRELTLEQISSVQGVVCGALICLESGQESETGSPSLLSPKAGNIVFFSAGHPLSLEPLTTHPGARYWMLVYGRVNAVYIHQENDPNGHFLKGLGYAFGDKLLDRSHPILYR